MTVRRLGALVILALGLSGCPGFRASGPPERVLEPEAVGVVAEVTTARGSDRRRYVLEDGREITPEGDIDRLSGPGPEEGRLLIVATDADVTYMVSLVRRETMTGAAECYAIDRAAWARDGDIIFGFPDSDVGLRLPADPTYRPQSDEETGAIRGVHGSPPQCVTPDGIVRGAS